MPRPAATVLHVDLDAFYVSMELLRHPELRGKPVIVGGAGGRGVVTTCSYEARKFGVRSAMPGSQARRLCPHAVFLDVDFSFYMPASAQFHAILRDFSPLVEPAGSDEAYMDVAGCERLFGTPEEIGATIRRRVTAEIGINASVGISTSKMVSKVASDACKPNGLLAIPAGGEAAFLAPRAIRDLPFVGPKTAESLQRLGVKTIGDLQQLSTAILVDRMGPHGAELHARSLGIDDNAVSAGRGSARSISREITFEHDEPSEERIRAVIRGQAERIAADMDRQERSARTVTLKLRFPPFETITRSMTAGASIDLADELFELGTALFTKAWEENGRRPIRLIGIGVTNLGDRARQMRLGERPEQDRLAEIVGTIREKFGDSAVQRAAELRRNNR